MLMITSIFQKGGCDEVINLVPHKDSLIALIKVYVNE